MPQPTWVDGLNRSTSQQYDTLNRLRRITQPPPAALQPNPVIQIDVNARDDITQVTDPRNLATTYTVNASVMPPPSSRPTPAPPPAPLTWRAT